MKILFLASSMFLSMSFMHAPLSSNEKMIYGEDDRIDLSQMSMRSQGFATGVATMATKADFSNFIDGYAHFPHEDLIKYRICLDENYVKQSLLGNCTGFLVDKDILVTAGHCFDTLAECRESQWIFDYNLKESSDLKVPVENVFSCKRVIEKNQSDEKKLDYAVIQLDRKVQDFRHLFKVARTTPISKGLNLGMIGHPTGLPVKYAGPFTPLDTSEETTFSAKVDAFGGNSGSPVFENRSGMVYGMLIGGAADYEEGRYQCKESVQCDADDTSEFCNLGETILRTSVIDVLGIKEYRASHHELSIDSAEDLLTDFYGWTLLHDAVYNGDIDQVKFLTEIGVDLNAAANFNHLSPALMAIVLDEMDILQYLITQDINLNLQDKSKGETLLMKVINKEYIDLALKLIDNGADITLKAHDGFSACDMAGFIGSYELLQKCDSLSKR